MAANRKQYTDEFRRRVVQAYMARGDKTGQDIATEYRVPAAMIYQWYKRLVPAEDRARDERRAGPTPKPPGSTLPASPTPSPDHETRIVRAPAAPPAALKTKLRDERSQSIQLQLPNVPEGSPFEAKILRIQVQRLRAVIQKQGEIIDLLLDT